MDAGVWSAAQLVEGLKEGLVRRGVDFERVIDDLGQVAASERRAQGAVFSFPDHLRGLVLSLLSTQRPWRPIAEHRGCIEEIFLRFDPARLEKADPQQLVLQVRQIRCGNRVLVQQMQGLPCNIAVLRRIEHRFGSLDAFVTSGCPEEIARLLSSPGPWKLKMVGTALAFEYLKNVGIRAAKPDLHLLRVLGQKRLGYFRSTPTPEQGASMVGRLASQAGVDPVYLDNLLWMYCARDYGQICGAKPLCPKCPLSLRCRQGDADVNTLA